MENMASENRELSRGHKQYDAVIQNIKGILNKIDTLFDVSEYKEKVKEIEEKVKNDDSLNNNMLILDIQMDYEDMIYYGYIDEIKKITDEVNEKYVPFYELYLLTANVNSNISINNYSLNLENIKDIIDDTIKLVNSVNNLNTHNIKEKNVLIDEAYKVIYKVVLYEEMFNRSDVLDYINKKNISVNRENLGRLLANDIKYLSEEEIRNEDLRVIRDEGLGYDYLNRDIIKKLSKRIMGNVNSEYLEKKQRAIKDFDFEAKKVKDKEDELLNNLSENKQNITVNRFQKAFLRTKILSLLLIPVITFSAGKQIGKNISNKITEYKTITRSIELNSGKIIGVPEEVYDEKETTYVATVTRYTPWRENPVGSGYIRNAIAYEFTMLNDVSENYHISLEEIDNNVIEKYRFTEAKQELDSNDSLIDESIIVTETYQDKLDNRKSTKYIVPLAIVGAAAGIAISVILVLFNYYGIEETKKILDELNDEIRDKKLDNKQIKFRLLELEKEAIKLKEEFADIESKYGQVSDNVYYIDKNNKILIKRK